MTISDSLISSPERNLCQAKNLRYKTGVENAKYDIVVVTDADCKPASAHWLEHLIGSYLADTDFVLGYSLYYKAPTLLNKIIRYENVMTAMQYLSICSSGYALYGSGSQYGLPQRSFSKIKSIAQKAKKRRAETTTSSSMLMPAAAPQN
jgi:hypothetical protein